MTLTTLVRTAVITAVLAGGAAVPAVAQSGFGAKGGVSLATQQVTPDNGDAERQWLTGLVAGAFYRRPLGGRLDLQVEGLYAVKGSRLRIAGLTEDVQIDYFEIPAVVRIRFGRYHAEGGASVAVRLRARAQTPFAGSTESVDIKSEVEPIDYGGSAGGGVEFGRYSIDFRFTQGLKNIDADKANDSRTKNRAIAVTGGVRF